VESEKIMLSVVNLTSLQNKMVMMAAKGSREIQEKVAGALFDLTVIIIIL
jgi:hypothetical protein